MAGDARQDTQQQDAQHPDHAQQGAANRRRFDRRDTTIAARLEHAGTQHAGSIDNLSLTGFLFNPPLDLPSGAKVKLWLADRAKPLAGSVVGVSPRGLHGKLHVAAPKLAQLSVEMDDMALLLIGAARAPATPPRPAPGEKPKNQKPKAQKPAAKKSAARPRAKTR